MGDWSTGSFYEVINNSVSGITDSISGNVAVYVDQCGQTIKNYTGIDPGSPTVPEKYQPAILACVGCKVTADVLSQNGEADSFRLGDFNVKNNDTIKLKNQQATYCKQAEVEKKELGRDINFYVTFT